MDTADVKTLAFPLGRRSSHDDESPPPKRLRVDDPPAIATVQFVELIDGLETAEATDALHFGLFLWPSALVLARFIAFYNTERFAERVVLELGCGIALPGILTAVCGHAKKVFLSDRTDARTVERNVVANVALNGVADVASFLPLDWGSLELLDLTETLHTVDVILAADCFYQSQDFEKVLATVALVFRLNPHCRFLTAYQLRSINRSIAPLLLRYNMTATVLHKSEFMGVTDVPGADSVYLYEISPMQY